MNRDAYAHGLASDWKQRSAMSTASKVGGAYAGWAPKARHRFANHIRAVVFALIAAGALTLIERGF